MEGIPRWYFTEWACMTRSPDSPTLQVLQNDIAEMRWAKMRSIAGKIIENSMIDAWWQRYAVLISFLKDATNMGSQKDLKIV